MSNSIAAFRVGDQLASRVLNHRQFTNGEISYLVKEMEEKANLEKNFDRILKTDHNVCIIVDNYANGLSKFSDQVTKDIGNRIGSLIEKTHGILRIEEDKRKEETNRLEKSREARERDKREAQSKVLSKLEQLDETLMKEELELEKKYLKFEENMMGKR